MRSLIRKLRRDSEGATIVEFAILLVPMMIVLLGAFDIGYQAYVRSVLQGVLNDVARSAAVESPAFMASGSTTEERVGNAIEDRVNNIARNATYTIEMSNYYDFSGVQQPEKLITDVNGNGEYDTGDCWEDSNPNGSFDTDAAGSGIGGADDVAFYEVTVVMPRIVPVQSLIGVPSNYTITAQAAVRNQPFGVQEEAATVCG